MENHSPFFFADEDNFDDVDTMFSKLQTFEPPTNMVARIMDAVSKLPSPQELQRQQQRSFVDVEGLIVHHDDREPS